MAGNDGSLDVGDDDGDDDDDDDDDDDYDEVQFNHLCVGAIFICLISVFYENTSHMGTIQIKILMKLKRN